MASRFTRRAFCIGLAAAISLVGSALHAQQSGVYVSGVELCPQFICEEGAIFVYHLFESEGGRKVGGGYVQIDHNAELPQDVGSSVPISDGVFSFRLGWLFISGEVIGGEIRREGSDLFSVSVLMLTRGGIPLYFDGELDHEPLSRRPPRPPVIRGSLFAGT